MKFNFVLGKICYIIEKGGINYYANTEIEIRE